MNLPQTMKSHVSREFLTTWESSLHSMLNIFLENDYHEMSDEILVHAYWNLHAKDWISNQEILRELFKENLQRLYDALGANTPELLRRDIARCLGSRISPDTQFWIRLSHAVRNDDAFKGRLIQTSQLGNSNPTSVENSILGIAYLINKPFDLRDYQREMIHEILTAIANKEHQIMLKLPTGSGKTRVALEAIFQSMYHNHVHTCLWIADEKQLCEQAIDSAKLTFHGSDQRLQNLILVSFFDSNALVNLNQLRDNGEEKMLIVCTPDQLTRNIDLLPEIDLYVMDEAHTSIQQRSELFKNTNAKIRLGLSATPPTHWIRTKTLSPRMSFDASIKSTKEYLIEEGVLSKPMFHSRKMTDEIEYNSLVELFRDDEKPKFSDAFVIYSILYNLQKDLQANTITSAIVFVDRVQQASILSAAFNLLMPNHASTFIEGRMKKSQRNSILKNFRDGTIDVLFNVKMLREGFDSPNIDGVYLALMNNPEEHSTKYLQMVGRGLRGPASEGGTEYCHIVTIDFSQE